MISSESYVFPSGVKRRKNYNSILLYEYKTWSLAIREGGGLSVFQKRELKNIFGNKRIK
jgi:hypothetical protein